MRLTFVLPAAIFLALVAVFGVYLYQVGPGGKDISEVPSAMIDKPVPVFDLPPIAGDGPGFATKDLAGKVALINVFASWCPPCRAEHPMLMQLAKDGVALYGINYKDKPEDALAFLNELGDPFKAIGADRTGRAAIDLGVYGYPETFVIDRTGRIRYRHVGPIMPDDLERTIRPMLDRLGK